MYSSDDSVELISQIFLDSQCVHPGGDGYASHKGTFFIPQNSCLWKAKNYEIRKFLSQWVMISLNFDQNFVNIKQNSEFSLFQRLREEIDLLKEKLKETIGQNKMMSRQSSSSSVNNENIGEKNFFNHL